MVCLQKHQIIIMNMFQYGSKVDYYVDDMDKPITTL